MDQTSTADIMSLPPDELASILAFLTIDEIASLACTSKSLSRACQDERVWYTLCKRTWSTITDIHQWVVPPSKQHRQTPPLPHNSSPSMPSPSNLGGGRLKTYRELFHLMRQIEGLDGLFRVIGEGYSSALISFSFTQDGLLGEELFFPKRNLYCRPETLLYHKISPSSKGGVNTSVEWGDDTVTLKINPTTSRASPHSASTERGLFRSSSAEAAAAVSFYSGGSSPHHTKILPGTSPEGSFEYAWLEFMNSSIQKSSRARRKSFKDGPLLPRLLHLRRIVAPVPSRKHPLAGMWVGDYGPECGNQIVRIVYDFRGKAARVIAEKVTGDEGVPAGLQTWWAMAAPIQSGREQAGLALPEEEQVLFDSLWTRLMRVEENELRQHTGTRDNGGISDATNELAAMFLEDEEEEEDGIGSMDGVPTRQQNTPGGREQREVVSVHVGAGHCAVGAGHEREWVEGRLWMHVDGSLTMWWLDAMRFVRYRRIDDDIRWVRGRRRAQ